MRTKGTANWDQRAWTWAILTGNGIGLLDSICHNVTVQVKYFIWFESSLADDAYLCLFLPGVLLLPGLISSIARRYYLRWGLLPLVLLDFWHTVPVVLRGGSAVLASLQTQQLFLVVCWLVSSGSVSVVRWRRERTRQRQTVNGAYQDALNTDAAVPQEGVWPPPPDYRP